MRLRARLAAIALLVALAAAAGWNGLPSRLRAADEARLRTVITNGVP